MTAALRYVQSCFFADFVCLLDADEFIAAPDRSAFLDALAAVPVGQASEHAWQTFLPDPSPGPGDGRDFLDDMNCRRIRERPATRKCFMRLGGGCEPELRVKHGNHGFKLNGRPVRSHPVRSVPLHHLPVRSAAQILTRGAVGWATNLARTDAARTTRVAFQWKRLHDLASKGNFDLSRTELCDEAMAYAQYKLPGRFGDNAMAASHGITSDRRYSDGRPGDPDRIIATSLLRADTYRPFVVPQVSQGPGGKPDVDTAFDAAWHARNVFLDAPPFRFLAQKHRPASVLDVGCGTGLYLRLMQHDGVNDVLGLDGLDRSATALDARTYVKTDLQQPFDARRRFDLVFCLEVAEHLAPRAMPVLLDTVERHARGLIVFSMAEPGQPGNRHINCRTMAEVLALWKARGWTPDLIETLSVRALSTMSWFRRNIIVLRNEPATDDCATEALLQIANLQYGWYSQKRGPVQTAFERPFPPCSVGYGRVVSPLAR